MGNCFIKFTFGQLDIFAIIVAQTETRDKHLGLNYAR